MTNTTLEKMQEIETAAEEVLMGYRKQAQELRQQVDENLRRLGLTYDDETQLAEELTASSQQKLVLLRQDLEQTTQQNEDKVAAALTDKKADLARAIVEKVVEAYGH